MPTSASERPSGHVREAMSKTERRFHLGCAVWGYKDWVGELFRPGSKSAELLWLYSRRLTTVEGNTTFYETNLFYLSVLP